jgi:phosphoglycolate phosphatase
MIHGWFNTIIFDFDYTLADSSRGIIACTRHALETMNIGAVPDDAVCRTIGMSLQDTFKVLTAIDDAGQAAEFSRLFISRADEVMVHSTELFDSTHAVMRSLKESEIRLGIVSTKYRCRIEAVLERDGLLDIIDVIVGGEDVTRHKPDPEGLLRALEALETPGSRALYVGDSVVDAIVAGHAGTGFVAVLSGTTPRREFEQYEPLEIIDKLSDLPRALARPAFGVRQGEAPQE